MKKLNLLIGCISLYSIIFYTAKISCTVQVKNGGIENLASSSGLLKNVLKHSPRISEEEIKESEIKIIKNAHEEEKKILDKYGKCLKDYTLPCPNYWKRRTDKYGKNVCIANEEYNGFCEQVQIFDEFSEHEKMSYESSCNVEWGCKGSSKEICESGKRDYNVPCPEGFLVQNDNSCKADISVYRGMCNNETINFTHLTSSEKENWSIACEAYWPCYTDCISEEYISDCPKNWKQVNKYDCIPDKNYKGPCRNIKNFKYFTLSMKKDFEEKCKTKFECNNICEKNYEQECPLNWKVEKGYCLAPDTFDLCKRKKISIENMTRKEKENIEKECFVSWPCINNKNTNKPSCQINWLADCPFGWDRKKEDKRDQKKDEYVCILPTEKQIYTEENKFNSLNKEKCTNIFLKKNSDEVIKREIASVCNTPWPCLNNEKIYISHNVDHEQKEENEKLNGPLTNEGKIYKNGKYHIVEEGNFSLSDIMK